MGSILGLNKISARIKKLIGYSFIFDIVINMSIIKFNFTWILYLITYWTLVFVLFTILKKGKINNAINTSVFRNII